MWIQNSRGKFRLYERYTDADGIEHKVSVPLRSEASRDYKEAVSKLMLKIADQERSTDEIRFSEAVSHFLNRETIKESTRKSYKSILGKLFDIFGNPYLSRLTNAYVKRQLSESDMSIKRKNMAITVLKALTKYAIEYGYRAEIITLRPFKESKKVDDISKKYLEGSELQSVLNQLIGVDYYFSKFLALTGCRFGEAAALTLMDYDGKYISINKTVWHGIIQTAKTESSERQIYVQTELRKLLTEYLAYRNTLLMARGVRTDLLFFNRIGTYINNGHFNEHLQAVKCNKPLHAHIFRHTHASLLAEAGYSLESISRRLGHSDSEITKKIYLHVTEKIKEREEAQLDKITLII